MPAQDSAHAPRAAKLPDVSLKSSPAMSVGQSDGFIPLAHPSSELRSPWQLLVAQHLSTELWQR
jgi:hypothetical protein